MRREGVPSRSRKRDHISGACERAISKTHLALLLVAFHLRIVYLVLSRCISRFVGMGEALRKCHHASGSGTKYPKRAPDIAEPHSRPQHAVPRPGMRHGSFCSALTSLMHAFAHSWTIFPLIAFCPHSQERKMVLRITSYG